MVIGVPREIKDHETRVGLVPSGVHALREAGHEVLVEASAGDGSSISDEEYRAAGAVLIDAADAFERTGVGLALALADLARLRHRMLVELGVPV